MSGRTPVVVIVSGPPASGKSSVAAHLAHALGLPLIAKDEIKESLSDSLGVVDHDGSKRLGAATWALLFVLAERLLEGRASFVFESNFYPEMHTVRLEDLRRRLPFVPIEVHCTADAETLYRRDRDRPRHPVHTRRGSSSEVTATWITQNAALALTEHVVEVDTTDPEQVDLDHIVRYVRSVWDGSEDR